MPITNKYVSCKECGHQASLYKIFGVTGKTHADMRYIESKIYKLKCSKCNSKGCAQIIDETRQQPVIYLASSEQDVFHKDSCGWLNRTSNFRTRRFNSRASAISAGCKPCSYCKP